MSVRIGLLRAPQRWQHLLSATEASSIRPISCLHTSLSASEQLTSTYRSSSLRLQAAPRSLHTSTPVSAAVVATPSPEAVSSTETSSSSPLSPVDGDASATAAAPRSSCPAGTVLQGLNYLQDRQDPVALPDEEYPEWLWSCLDVTVKDQAQTDDNAGDEFSKSAKQRKLAAKRQRQLQAAAASGGISAEAEAEEAARKVPLHHQSTNFSAADLQKDGWEGVQEVAAKRQEVTKAMRKDRKSKIREANYLKTM